MHKNENAQSSIDFLTAISIFLLTLAYLLLQVPTIFAPFQSQSTDLQPVAYRTGMTLAEDTGWWDGGAGSGPDWENASLNDICRIGLAANKHNPNNFSELMNRGKVCVLSEKKIKRMDSVYDSAMHIWIRDRLGLNITRTYAYNISLQYLNGTSAEPMYVPNNTNPALCIGTQIPETTEVEKMERLVAVEGDCGVGYLSTNAATNTSNITMSLPRLDLFMVKWEDFANESRSADARLSVVLNNTNQQYNNASVINKSGLFVGGWHQFNKTVIDGLCDSNEIAVNVSWCNVSYMWVNRSDWGSTVGDITMPSAKLVVCIW